MSPHRDDAALTTIMADVEVVKCQSRLSESIPLWPLLGLGGSSWWRL